MAGYDKTIDQISGRVVTLMYEALAHGMLVCNRCQDGVDASSGRIVRTASGVVAVHSALRCPPPAPGKSAQETARSRWFRRMMGEGDGS